MKYIVLGLLLLSSCKEVNSDARKEVQDFLISNRKLRCVTIEKNDSDNVYEMNRMTIVCGKRRIDND